MDDAQALLLGLGRALQARRDERRLTQQALSDRTGVHWNYIGGIERGERNPTVTIIAKLAVALEISLAELFAQAEAG